MTRTSALLAHTRVIAMQRAVTARQVLNKTSLVTNLIHACTDPYCFSLINATIVTVFHRYSLIDVTVDGRLSLSWIKYTVPLIGQDENACLITNQKGGVVRSCHEVREI